MAIEQSKVHEIVKQAVSKNVDIPEFQREFVWDAEQVKKLAESLYRNYPVGSFLLWDSSQYQESKTAQGSQASLWIIDGQQRTTALCLMLGQKPYWWNDAESWNKALQRYDVMVNILPEDSNEYMEFGLPNPIRRHDPHWISIRHILAQEKVEDLTQMARKIAQNITSDPNLILEIFDKVHGRINRIWNIREIDIPLIKINHEIEDVAEIFARLNQEGTRVKEADVVLALAAVRNPGWVRDEYLPFRNDLQEKGWDLDAGVFVRTIAAIGKGRARLIEVPKEFWKPENLSIVWKTSKEAIAEVIKRLSEFGILSTDLLPSTNSLIPLFVLNHRWQNAPGYRFEKAYHWFLLANRDGRYSGSAITSLNEDVRSIMEAKEFEDALEALRKRLQSVAEISEEEFLNRYDRAGNRFLRLMLYLILFRNKARDWVDQTFIGFDKSDALVTTGFEPQWHHIFPRNILRNAGFSDDDIHALANITVLNERTNANKLSGKNPSNYILQYNITEQMLRDHIIPDRYTKVINDLEALTYMWRVENYTDFLVERAHLLAIQANKILRELEGS